MPARLSDRDVHDLLAAVRDVSAVADPDAFGRVALQASMRLVPCEVGTYNEVEAGGSQVVWEPAKLAVPEAERVLAELQEEHPLIREIARTGDGSPRAISDFLTPDQFRRLSLYRLIFGPLGLEDQLAVGLPAPGPVIVGIALNRRRRGFPERDRRLLQLFRPHLVQARANARLQRELRARLAALEAGVAADGRSILRARDDGGFDALTPQAERALRRYFDSRGRRLPDAVLRWLAAERGRLTHDGGPVPLGRPLVIRQSGRRLVLRYVRAASQELILVTEHGRDRGVEALLSLGLSPREADVLQRVADGRTNREIAADLHVSLSTVKRRLESVFRKLGVTSRAAAATCAVDALTVGIRDA